jgi:hypothetical protein
VGKSRSGQKLHRGIIVDAALNNQAAVAVVGVSAKANVRYHHQPVDLRLEGSHSPLNHAVFPVSFAGPWVLLLGHTEQHDGGDTKLSNLLGFQQKLVRREMIDTRHGGNLLTDVLAGDNEHGVDKVVYRKPGLTNHTP